jgi:hypothetical protein
MPRYLPPLFAGIFLVFLGFVLFSPNPYANNPDAIADESYFLTSSLSAIQKHTLPGWEFSPSGNYYGGPQTYIDTVVLVPVVAGIVATHHFSITATEGYVATHTGDLLHIVRLVNGALAFGTVVFLLWFFYRRKVPAELARTLLLYGLLLLSNALLIQLLHTAKVWDLYVIVVSGISTLFIAQTYYQIKIGKKFLSDRVWVGLLIWSSIVLLFQNYVGAFATGLLGLYALFLGQIRWSDIFTHIRRYWYLMILAGITQLSFLYRAVFINFLDGSFSNISVKTSSDHVVWMLRVVNPILYAVLGTPLSLFYLLAVAAFGIWVWRARASFLATFSANTERRYLMVAFAHPLLIYGFFGLLVGFDSSPRYGIIVSTACAFSIAILFSALERWWGEIPTYALSLLAALCFVVIGVHAIQLYWHPSSEAILTDYIQTQYNDPSNIFIEEVSALRLTLPINDASLGLLNQKRADFGRFAFLIAHPGVANQNTNFKARTLTVYSPEEEADVIRHLSNATTTLWTVNADCTQRCTSQETIDHTCFEIHANTCDTMLASQEVNFQAEFLGATQLGYPYIVRKVH